MPKVSEEEKQNRVALMAVMSKRESGIPSETKKRRNPPDPDAQVVALSPRSLVATSHYICEVCHKGFQRDQNLQLHRKGHNLPCNLRQRSSTEAKKRVYVCPETTCTHHDPNRDFGDLTGIKKHYSRKHGEKKWKCDKCPKKYAVQSDWKAHSKICGTKEYLCDCGTIFSRKDSFVTHWAFCDIQTAENYRTDHGLVTMVGNLHSQPTDMLSHSMQCLSSSIIDKMNISGSDPNTNRSFKSLSLDPLMQASSIMLFSNENLRTADLQQLSGNSSSRSMSVGSSFMSATALLQKAAEMGVKVSDESTSPITLKGFTGFSNTTRQTGTMPDTTNSYNNNYDRCLDIADVSSEAFNAIPSSVGGSFFGFQNALQMSSKRNADDSGFRTTGEVPFPFGGESMIDSNRRRDQDEDNAERRNGRMTQDFLGLDASGSMSVEGAGNSNYNEDEMYSYNHMSNGPTIVGKHMWDY